jgi:hypothetical protein
MADHYFPEPKALVSGSMDILTALWRWVAAFHKIEISSFVDCISYDTRVDSVAAQVFRPSQHLATPNHAPQTVAGCRGPLAEKRAV